MHLKTFAISSWRIKNWFGLWNVSVTVDCICASCGVSCTEGNYLPLSRFCFFTRLNVCLVLLSNKISQAAVQKKEGFKKKTQIVSVGRGELKTENVNLVSRGGEKKCEKARAVRAKPGPNEMATQTAVQFVPPRHSRFPAPRYAAFPASQISKCWFRWNVCRAEGSSHLICGVSEKVAFRLLSGVYRE